MEELAAVLAKFHREVLLPDVERIVTASERRLRDEMHSLFDSLSQRLERLETEYHMLVAAVKRIEDRLDKMVLRSEFLELKARLDELQERMRSLEAHIQD